MPQTTSLWTTYRIQTGSLQGLGFGLGLVYLGEREATLPNSLEAPSYVRPDLAIFYQRGNVRVALNIKNVSNVKYYVTRENLLFPEAPFTVLGSVSVTF